MNIISGVDVSSPDSSVCKLTDKTKRKFKITNNDSVGFKDSPKELKVFTKHPQIKLLTYNLVELENSYNLFQDFMEAIQSKDKKKIKELITTSEAVGALMHKTLLTFKRNLTHVVNGIESEYSNGCLEGYNRKIKQIERTAYGYSRFTNLLARIR